MADHLQRRRVALFLPDFGGGGAERVALAQIRELVRRGHGVELVLIRGGGELIPLLPPAVKVIEFNAHRILAALPKLVRYLRRAKPDALHAVMWPSTIVAVAAHRLARSRALLMISDQVTLSKQMHRRADLAVLRWTTRVFYPLADVRVLCSAEAADDLARLAHLPRASVEVITNPVEPPDMIAQTEDAQRVWGNRCPRILTIGSLKEQKNHALLLNAFARMNGYPNAGLTIVGEGTLRKPLEELAVDLGISARVSMPGFFLDPWPLLASADLFVLSSDYEGFPLVLAEAMYAGLRVVSTDCTSGPAELMENGAYGSLVPCNDPDALAHAITIALREPAQPDRQRTRAAAVAGAAQIARYCDLLTREAA